MLGFVRPHGQGPGAVVIVLLFYFLFIFFFGVSGGDNDIQDCFWVWGFSAHSASDDYYMQISFLCGYPLIKGGCLFMSLFYFVWWVGSEWDNLSTKQAYLNANKRRGYTICTLLTDRRH